VIAKRLRVKLTLIDHVGRLDSGKTVDRPGRRAVRAGEDGDDRHDRIDPAKITR
jgi:hypothetical protein